jgi:hypothetical protein
MKYSDKQLSSLDHSPLGLSWPCSKTTAQNKEQKQKQRKRRIPHKYDSTHGMKDRVINFAFY